MSSRDRQPLRNTREASQGTQGHRSLHTQRSNVNSGIPQPSGSSNTSSRTSERYLRPERSVFTLADGRNARGHAEGPCLFLPSARGERPTGPEGRMAHVQADSRGHRSSLEEARRYLGRPLGAAPNLPTARGRTTTTGAGTNRVRGEHGETPRSSIQTTYSRNLLANQRGNLRRSVSREIGRQNLVNLSSSSSSESHQPNPATFFTLVELESTKSTTLMQNPEISDVRLLPSEPYYKTNKMSDFKETIKNLDDLPDWLPNSTDSGILQNPPGAPQIGTTESVSSVRKTSGILQNPPVTPQIGTMESVSSVRKTSGILQNPPGAPQIGATESVSSVRKTLNNQIVGGKLGTSAASITFEPQKSLEPQELMQKLKEISENRRTYYVQKTGSDDDSMLDMLLQSPQRNSIESLLSLNMNVGRDFTPSTRALAGSMATLKFIELSKRKLGSVAQNATRTESKGDDHKVPHAKKCERFVPPIDVYGRDLIINVPIDPLSPVEPHETVDAPSVENLIMINQICEEIDNIFKDIHTGFYASQEQINTEDAALGNKLLQRTESDKQLLSELKLSLLPASQTVRRSIDSRISVQSQGSRHSSGGFSLGDPQQSLTQPSLSSLPQELQMDTEELIQILNQKYEKSSELESPRGTIISSHNSENDMKILYSSRSAHLKRQPSKKTLETVPDTDLELASFESNQKSALNSSFTRESSVVKSNLRRFIGTVHIPTISNTSINEDSTENEKQEEITIQSVKGIQTVKSQSSSQMRVPSGVSLISSSTIASSKMKETEKMAIAELVEVEFGAMRMDTITIEPNYDLETRTHSQLYEILATYADPGGIDDASSDILKGDPQLMVESGTTKQLMLHKAKFPMETISEEQGSSAKPGYSTARYKKRSTKKTLSHETYETSAKEQETRYEQEEMGEQSDEACNEWVKFTPSSVEEAKEEEIQEEEIPEQKKVTELVVDPEELRLLFPFAFRLSINCSWWKRPRFNADYRDPITKEKVPEFHDLRDQLKALLEEYEDNYSRFEAVYRWGDPRDPPVWNKKYRSPFLRPNVSYNQDPNRFHLSDDALSMKNGNERNDKPEKPPGHSTAALYVEPTKWWNLASVRRYVLRKELAKHTFDRHRMRLGLRVKPSKYSASLILGHRRRRSRKKGQVCRRRKDVNKTWVAIFMKRNLPRSMWQDLKTKYELASSLRYRQRHHWNPFHPSNKPSIDGATRLGWYGQSLIRKNNITFLGQFARGVDEKLQAEVKPITDSEIRDKWQRDIMEIAYVAYCTNKLITEELQFLVMIGLWLGVVIDEFSYFMKFVTRELGGENPKNTMYDKKHPKKIRPNIRSNLLGGTEKQNTNIWEKILNVCDKTLFMLKRGLLPVERDQIDQQNQNEEGKAPNPGGKQTEAALSIPWYENTKLRRTNRRLLDSIALAYPDFYYLASKTNKYYHVELDADEARWFPIRYYDADTGEYNFISHDHPKWPDWKFLHMTSYGNAFQINPMTFMPYKEDAAAASEDHSGLLSDENLDDDNQIADVRDSGSIKLSARANDSKVPEKKKALVLMLMRECFDEEGNFRYILINPIKFDRKRINMSFKTLIKTTDQICTDPNTVGLDDIRARFLQKPKLSENYIKLDPETFPRLLKKYAAQGENPRSFTDRRIDIALDYWYRKAAQVNQLLEAISFKISAIDRIFTFLQTHQAQKQLLVFDDPNSLKFQNEPVWNRRILENFQHGCFVRKDCDEEHLISRSSGSSSCSDTTDETVEAETPIDRIPSDFLKVMHTYFSLTTIETLKEEKFVDFPVPLETLYCYERMKKGPRSKQRVPYNKMSLGGRISERHRVRVERRRELNKLRDQRKAEGGGDEDTGDHARCMGNEDDPRTHVGFKSKCPICHKMLISHHPSLTLYTDFKSRHINEHRMNAERIKPPKKAGYIKLKDPHCPNSNMQRQTHNHGEKADTHEDCYLHCKVPTILSIFQGRSVTKNKQERLIRYFNRALHYEHVAVKDEITTRLNEETDELDFLKHKQNYLQELHDTICEKTTCPIISQQIQALLTHQEMVMRFKKRTILSSKYCKKRSGWPLTLLSHMTREEELRFSKFAHQAYPYTMTTNTISLQHKRLSRRIFNDLYICWVDAYSSGTDLLSELAPHLRSNRVYPAENFTTYFLDNIIKILRRPELPKIKEQSKIAATDVTAKSPFELWFEEFVKIGLLPKSSSSLNVSDEGHDTMSSISSGFNLLGQSEQPFARREDGMHGDAVSEFSLDQDYQGRHKELSSEDDSSGSHNTQNSQGRWTDVSPSGFESYSHID